MQDNKQAESALVIVLAKTQARENTFKLLKKNVLDNLQADLCLCVADNEREDVDNPFYRHAKYIWRYSESDDRGDAFDEAQWQLGMTADWRKILNVKHQWLGGIQDEGQQPGSTGILLFFRWFLKSRLLATGLHTH